MPDKTLEHFKEQWKILDEEIGPEEKWLRLSETERADFNNRIDDLIFEIESVLAYNHYRLDKIQRTLERPEDDFTELDGEDFL